MKKYVEDSFANTKSILLGQRKSHFAIVKPKQSKQVLNEKEKSLDSAMNRFSNAVVAKFTNKSPIDPKKGKSNLTTPFLKNSFTKTPTPQSSQVIL
jgi:hypothetical protein